jgi:hypothetical protein
MQGLIERCWSGDSSIRPSFDDILSEFQTRQFNILPVADCDEIRCAVDDVLKWKSRAAISGS